MSLGRWWQSWMGRRSDRRPAPGEALAAGFARDVAAALAGPLDRRTLDVLQSWPEAHGLSAEEVELELEMIAGAIAELDLAERVTRGPLPVLNHQHKALGTDVCHLAVSATLVDAEGGRSGRLFVTDRRLVFLATPLVALSWSSLRRLESDGRDLVAVAPSRGAAVRIRFGSFADARRVRWLSDHLRALGGAPGESVR
jgi:hypothetical protein